MKIRTLALRAATTGIGAFVLAGVSLAQNGISVIVDGKPVAFQGVGPQEVNGRVLVPLRGVLEDLGAYVEWDPNAQMVTAQRGNTAIDLRIGSTTAQVNNQPVTLDVPAEIYHGSTLVPLRFVSEALGADVRWEPTQYAVYITTAGSTSGERPQDFNNLPAAPPPHVDIYSLHIDRTGRVAAGEDVRFTMHGTPGGTARLTIPGIQRDIPMQEVSSGVYVADWYVPGDQDELNVSNLTPVAHLRLGDSEKTFELSQAAPPPTPEMAPRFLRVYSPDDGSVVTVARPTITAVFEDRGIEPASVRLLVDGDDVTLDADIAGHSITYVPAEGFGPGKHEVSLTATGPDGNPVTKHWTFRVNQGGDRYIQSFTAEGLDTARPGDILRFTMRGAPGGRATFSLGDVVTDKAMVERSPGVYVGTYTVRDGDDLSDLTAEARLAGNDGVIYEINSRDRADVQGLPLDPPTILLPRSDESLQNPLIVEGRAPAGNRVRVHVDYSTNVRGVAQLTGQIADEIVVADSNGHFRTRPISLDTTVAGRGVSYTITAITLGANNQESDPMTITVSR